MTNLHVLNRIRDATPWSRAYDVITRDKTRPMLARLAKELALHDVAHCLCGVAGRPPLHGSIESPALPPIGIAPGEMQHTLIPADAFSLADAIGRQHAPRAAEPAGREELQMLGVQLPPQRPCVRVVREKLAPVSAALSFGQELQELQP